MNLPKVDIKKAVTFVRSLHPVTLSVIAFAALCFSVLAVEIVVLQPRHNAVMKAEAKVQAATTTATSSATKTVVGLVSKSAEKTATVRQRQTENANVIQKLPTASAPVPDDAADAWRHGLCMYDSTSGDSACG
jgi:hypothetical protein